MTFTEALSEAVLLIEPPNHRHVAVMFVDLDHFTRMCTDDPPELVFRLVRKFQQIVSKGVSRCRGRLSSHLGDGAMATFSDLPGRSDCATRALRCAQAILARIQILSVEHINAGGRAVSISIGLQYGRILSGTINGAKRFGPMIIGDAVNVANRLEQQAHALSTNMVVGDDLIQRASREARPDGSERAQLVYVGPIAVYGRGTPVDVWVLSNGSMNC
jgi:adenylate cyclase